MGLASRNRPIDANRGPRDFADDVSTFLDTLTSRSLRSSAGRLAAAWRWGGLNHPETVAKLGYISLVSTYGFGGTRGDGTPCLPDYAGTGGGLANEELQNRIENVDRSTDSESSPRNVLRLLYTASRTRSSPTNRFGGRLPGKAQPAPGPAWRGRILPVTDGYADARRAHRVRLPRRHLR